MKKNKYIDLFLSFFKIGITTFGGGVMMVGNLKRELVEKRGWVTENEMYDYIAIAQVTPGVIMVNSATLIGAKKAGIFGAIISTIAVVLPSIIIISLIAFLLNYIGDLKLIISKFLIGIRVAVCATSIRVVINMLKTNIVDIFTFLLCVISVILSFFLSVPSAYLVILGIISGITIKHFSKDEEKKS